MPIMYNTGEWFKVRPDYYRKVELATPDWPLDLDLEYMQVAAAPYGGPLAAIRDPTKLVPVKGTARPMVRIFDTTGKETGHILWNHGKLIAMGWSDTEELICVQENAKVFVFDMFGKEKESYSIGDEASVTKIVEAKVFQSAAGTGVAVMTTSGRIFLKLNSSKTERKLPDIPNSSINCSCWEIVTEGRNSYCLLGREREVIKLFPGETVGTITANLFEKPHDRIIMISVSYNHQHLALYTNTGLLWLGSVDMRQKYCEFDTGRKDMPLQIEWIMNSDNSEADAVVISYPSYLLIVNRNADRSDFPYDPIMFLVAEMDGVRIITQSSHEMIQRLPKCVENIFAVNSQEPASYLFEAQKKFEEKSYKSDEYLSMCRDKIELAVTECIEAASFEFCTETQKSLLRTANFGKAFVLGHNPDEYMRIMRILRVLNTLRHERIAMPLTFKQFSHLNPEVILSRLVFRKHYAVAIQVAKHLNLPESWILEHWAYHKVMNDPNDSEVARKITEKFKNPTVEGISFCNIAEKAHQAGRDDLAIKLLELEPRASLHVPLLLKMRKFDRAVASATQSGDTELVTKVLLEMKMHMMLSNLHMTIRDYPLALNMYKKIMRETNRAGLYGIYNTEDDQKAIAEFHFRNAIESKDLESNLSVIGNAYTQARCTVEAELCAETSRLFKLQKTLSTKYNASLNGLSVHDTIEQLLRMGELKEAEKIRSDFKVPDRRFWWQRILNLAEQQKWDELEKFSKNKKSPIGYEPFVEVCLKYDNAREARKYIPRCRDNRKVLWFIRASYFEEAIDCAFEQRDLHSLYELQKKESIINDRNLLAKTCNCIAMLETRK
ncbi:vacuolar protein sorting-associated protein 16 homolog [Drosophila guanche]|uniref:Vacuolar protein sorting-associated protein 16 homolog n=2 Tax=Drosophila guanche TaxID=7266 RepID=A0A3B0K476_DROGU|nr:vacuolar protein sorting-associated protein 16 homolog [Drosophila guanche]SPP80809.1 blast:Juxtaposed with another zinc finger protein 1 [Drosophila guanche]